MSLGFDRTDIRFDSTGVTWDATESILPTSPLSCAAPVVSSAVLSQGQSLAPVAIAAANSPSISSPAISIIHALTGSSSIAGSPAFGSSALSVQSPVCNVLFTVLGSGGSPIEGAYITAQLERTNPTSDLLLVSRQPVVIRTDASGQAIVPLRWRSSFTRGGIYRLRVSDRLGKRIYERRVTAPSLESINISELEEV